MKITVVSVRTVPAQAKERQGKDDKLVLFQLDDANPQLIRLPGEGFSEATLTAAIRARLTTDKALEGKSFTL